MIELTSKMQNTAENALWRKVGKFMTHSHIYDYHWQWNAWNTVLQICPLGRKYIYVHIYTTSIQNITYDYNWD